jgi:hypothetical protein
MAELCETRPVAGDPCLVQKTWRNLQKFCGALDIDKLRRMRVAVPALKGVMGRQCRSPDGLPAHGGGGCLNTSNSAGENKTEHSFLAKLISFAAFLRGGATWFRFGEGRPYLLGGSGAMP